MEFKGTKGKWSTSERMDIKNNESVIDINACGAEVQSIATVWSNQGMYEVLSCEVKANAQLIAHAPEMLEKHYEEIEILEGILKNNPIGDMAFKLRMIIETKKDLITRATTI